MPDRPDLAAIRQRVETIIQVWTGPGGAVRPDERPWQEHCQATQDDVRSLLAYADALEAALREFLDLEESECRFDHHGNCQAHGACPPPCYVAEARKLLGGE